MENTTKQQIIDACQQYDNGLYTTYKGSVVIPLDYNVDKLHSYEVKSNTVMQTNYATYHIYGSAKITIDESIVILGYCNDTSFLDSL